MRNTDFNTTTTNSRGVKSSLSRITFQSFGRSAFALTLVRGLTTVCWLMLHPPGFGEVYTKREGARSSPALQLAQNKKPGKAGLFAKSCDVPQAASSAGTPSS